MSEKQPLLPEIEVHVIERQPARCRNAGRRLWMTLFYGAVTYLVLRWLVFPTVLDRPVHSNGEDLRKGENAVVNTTVSLSSKVALEAHMMSKCPDAKRGLEQLVVPVMSEVSDLVDFKLSFIGNLGKHDDNVECMHGPEECLGNIVELCAADIYHDPKQYLGFTMCMTADYQHVPQRELVQQCALEHGLDFGKINDCVSKEDGAYGVDLLRESVTRTQEAGVRYSLTLRLDGKVRCIMDGGEWRDCPGGSKVEDVVKEIKKLSEA